MPRAGSFVPKGNLPRGQRKRSPLSSVTLLPAPPSSAVPARGGKKAGGPPTRPGKHPGVPPGATPFAAIDKNEKLLQLKQQLMAEHLCTTEIDNRLDALRAARAPVVKPPAQALVMATNAHHKATAAREKMQSTVAMLQKQLTEALRQLEASHLEEANAAAEVGVARKRVADAPSAPQLPAVVLQNTAKNLHSELSKATGVPSVDQLTAALGVIMEREWASISTSISTPAPGTPSVFATPGVHVAIDRSVPDLDRISPPAGAWYPNTGRDAGRDLRGLAGEPQRCEHVRGLMSWCPGQPSLQLRSICADTWCPEWTFLQLRCFTTWMLIGTAALCNTGVKARCPLPVPLGLFCPLLWLKLRERSSGCNSPVPGLAARKSLPQSCAVH